MIKLPETLFEAFQPNYHDFLTNLWLTPVIVGLLTVLYITGTSIYLLYLHPLSNVPGPFLAKLSNWWQGYYAAKLLKAGKIQGKTARFAFIM